MFPVESASLRSREGEGEGGADLRRLWWVLVAQVSASGRLLGVRGVIVTANFMPRQCCRGRRKLTRLYLGVFVVICIAPYISLRRSLGRKLDENRPNRRDGVGQKTGDACFPDKVGYSGCALCGALDKLVQVEVGHTGRSVGRRPRASLRREVRTSFVHTVKHLLLPEVGFFY